MSSRELGLARLARAFGWIAAIVGALIVVGWVLDETIVPSGVEGSPVKANVGVGFLLAGVALAVRWRGRAALVSRALGAGAALIGVLTLVEQLFRAELGIDQLLFNDRSSLHPGQMPPNTAAAFVLVGAALVAAPGRTSRQAVEDTGLIAALIGWIALVGLAADLPGLTQVGDFERMAAPTAVCFVLLGVGIALIARHGRLAALTASEGPAGPLARRLLLAVLVAPPAVALVLGSGRSAGVFDEGDVTLLLVGVVAMTLLAVALSFAHSLERSDEARSIEEERRQAILDTARDAIVSADSAGRIVAFNLAAERTFGLPATDALGQPLTILMPERFHAAHQAGMRRYLAGGEARVVGRTVELAGRRADGEEFPLELSLAAFKQGDETLFTGNLSDITARKRDEAYRAAQHEVTRVFAEARTAHEALAQLAPALGEQLGWQWVAFWTVDPACETIGCEALWHDPACAAESFVRATRAPGFRRGTGLPGTVWAGGAIEWMDDVTQDTRFARTSAAAEVGFHSAVAVPLRRAGNVVGVLELLSTAPRFRDELLVDVLHGIGDQVGQFLERMEAEQALRSSERGLSQSQSMARLGSWSWSVATNAVNWSDELYRLYGVAPGDFDGTFDGFLERVHPEDRDAMAAAAGQAYSTGETFNLDHRTIRPDGSQRVLHCYGEVVRDEQGSPVGMAGTGQDVTEQRAADRQISRQARQLEERASELQRSNAELEQFAYVASHDLQEPLRSVAGFVQLLGRRYEGQLDPEADRFIAFAVAGAERMQTLIEDLLRYSRAGRRELRREQVDSRAVVERTLRDLEAAMDDAGAEVMVGDLPTLDADEAALGQLFQNLIGNALKYHDGEPPRVAVSAAHTGGAWSFTVADNGIGIEPGHAERIFRMFQRLHPRDEYAGTGIGLAICKQVVERHGGRIWCDPRPEGGSFFHFTIPDREAEQE